MVQVESLPQVIVQSSPYAGHHAGTCGSACTGLPRSFRSAVGERRRLNPKAKIGNPCCRLPQETKKGLHCAGRNAQRRNLRSSHFAFPAAPGIAFSRRGSTTPPPEIMLRICIALRILSSSFFGDLRASFLTNGRHSEREHGQTLCRWSRGWQQCGAVGLTGRGEGAGRIFRPYRATPSVGVMSQGGALG